MSGLVHGVTLGVEKKMFKAGFYGMLTSCEVPLFREVTKSEEMKTRVWRFFGDLFMGRSGGDLG